MLPACQSSATACPARFLQEVQDIADPPHVQLQEAEAQPPAGTAGGAAAAGQEEEEEMLMLVEEEEYNEEHPGKRCQLQLALADSLRHSPWSVWLRVGASSGQVHAVLLAA